MKRLIVLGLASLVGYVVGVITLLVWSGIQLYEGTFGNDDD